MKPSESIDVYVYLFELKLCLEAASAALNTQSDVKDKPQTAVALKFLDQATDAAELLEAELFKKPEGSAND